MPPTLEIIIVNWNAGDQLQQCLESISAVRVEGFVLRRVVVVDNASRDGSADPPEGLELPLTVIRNHENRGFAAACNQGAEGSEADYLLFLNPDTRLTHDSLCAPVNFMEQAAHRQAGICGIQLINDRGDVAPSCVRFPTPGRLLAMTFGLQRLFPRWFPPLLMVDWDHRDTRAVDQVMGAFFLIRGPLLRDLTGFDERFFVYWEEVDLSYRARQRGWATYYLADAHAYHKGQGTIAGVFPVAFFYLLRSRTLYCFKHFGRLWGAVMLLLTLLVEPLSRSLETLLRLSGRDALQVLRAYGYLWRALPRLNQAKELKS